MPSYEDRMNRDKEPFGNPDFKQPKENCLHKPDSGMVERSFSICEIDRTIRVCTRCGVEVP